MKHTFAFFLFALASLPGYAGSLPPDVSRALSAIRTVTGQNVLQRMKSCKITFADGAWVEKQTVAIPQIVSLAGDTILEVYINIPPMPGDDRPEAKIIYNDLFAQWIIRNNQAIPISGWAKTLQESPRPIRSVRWLDC
jgi:hypothetical protein